jgi:hypothetical protein
VDHFPDKTVTNDAANNVRWRTLKQNIADRVQPKGKGAKPHITFETACVALWMFEQGATFVEVAKFTGLTNKGVQWLKARKTWKKAIPVPPRKPIVSETDGSVPAIAKEDELA